MTVLLLLSSLLALVISRVLFGLAAMRREARLTNGYGRTMESD